MLRALDLFCGCGGLSLGFEEAGFEVVAGIDNDQEALETFAKNFQNAQTYNIDISNTSDIPFEQIGEIDVILGGPPCQGFSIAGKRQADDPRNQLIDAYIDIVKQLNPKAVLIENVPNILNMADGKFRDSITENLEKLGFSVSIEKLNSADFGVPQNRKRVFFFGLKNQHFELEKMHALSTVTCKDAISDLPDFDLDNGADYVNEALSSYQKELRRGSSGVWNHILTNHSDQTKEIISLVPDGGNYKDLPTQLQSTRKVNIAWTRFSSSKPSFTIDTGHRHHFHYEFNRIPTVRESARLQSFPDSFIFYGSKTSQYRQVGNAVPPLLAKVIFQQMFPADYRQKNIG